jgi:hypothetical protein
VQDPFFYLLADLVAYSSRSLELFFVSSGQGRWVFEVPDNSPGLAGKNRASFCMCGIADGYDMAEQYSFFKERKGIFRLVPGNIQAYFPHDLDGVGIQLAWFQTRAHGLEPVSCQVVEKRLSHLAPGAVMNAEEKHFLFRHDKPPKY